MTQKKILIVDDEPVICEVLTEILKISDYTSFAAVNGKEGLEAFEQHSPDLVITDMLMPVMDGYELALRIREVSDVPIMMLSGQVDLESEKERLDSLGLRIGAVMSKPIELEEFLNAVGSLVSTPSDTESSTSS